MNLYFFEDIDTQRTYINRVLKQYLQSINQIVNIIPVQSPITFFKKINSESIESSDIFFIDIDLKSTVTGIDIAEKIRLYNKQCKIIFLTGNSTAGINIMNKNILPFGYIVKTPNIADIERDIINMLNKIFISELSDINSLTLKKAEGNIIVPLSDINYFETIKGDRYHVYLQTINHEYVLNEEFVNIKKIAFPPNFIVNFKSYIININKIKELNPRLGILIFKNDFTLFLSSGTILKIKKALNKINFQI